MTSDSGIMISLVRLLTVDKEQKYPRAPGGARANVSKADAFKRKSIII